MHMICVSTQVKEIRSNFTNNADLRTAIIVYYNAFLLWQEEQSIQNRTLLLFL